MHLRAVGYVRYEAHKENFVSLTYCKVSEILLQCNEVDGVYLQLVDDVFAFNDDSPVFPVCVVKQDLVRIKTNGSIYHF